MSKAKNLSADGIRSVLKYPRNLDSFSVKIAATLLIISALFPTWMISNSNSRLDTSRSIVNDFTFEISEYSNNTFDKVVYKNQTFSDKAPGSALLGTLPVLGHKLISPYIPSISEDSPRHIPLDQTTPKVPQKEGTYVEVDSSLSKILLRFSSILFISTVPSILTVLLVNKYLKKSNVSQSSRKKTVVVTAFGTPILFFSTVYMGNTLAMLLIFSSFYIIETKRRARFYGLAGFLAGAAFLVEYYVLYYVAAFLLYSLVKEGIPEKIFTENQQFFAYLKGAFWTSLITLVYNKIVSNNPFRIPKTIVTKVPNYTFALHSHYVEGRIFLGFVIADYTPQILVLMLVGPGRGLLIYIPTLALSLFGLWIIWKENRKLYASLILVLSVTTYLFNSLYVTWYGGGVYGPRYAVPLIPFLALPLAKALDKIKQNQILNLGAYLLIVLSIFIASLGLTTTGLEPVRFQEGPEKEFAETYENITGIEPLLNPLPDNIDYLLERGYRSPWFSIIAGAPDHNINDFVLSDEDLTKFDIGGQFLVINRTFAEITFIALLTGIIWRKNILEGISRGQAATGIILLGVIFGAAMTSITDGYKGEGWYGKGDYSLASKEADYQYQAESSGLLSFNLNPELPTKVEIQTSQGHNRTLYIHRIENVTVPVEKSKNRIKFEFSRCLTPALTQNRSSLRCSSAAIKKTGFKQVKITPDKENMTADDYLERRGSEFSLDIQDIPVENRATKTTGWIETRDENITGFDWMSKNATIMVISSDNSSFDLNFSAKHVKPGPKPKEMEISTDTGYSTTLRIGQEDNVTVSIPVSKGLNRVNISANSCYIPSNFKNSTDTRCLSFRLSEIETGLLQKPRIQTNKWRYREEQFEDRRGHWIANRSQIEIFSPSTTIAELKVEIEPHRKISGDALKLSQNDSAVNKRSAPTQDSQNVTYKLALERLQNTVSLVSEEGCVVPSSISSSSDDRCLSFKIYEIGISQVQSDSNGVSDIFFGRGWYDAESISNTTDLRRWMSNQSVIRTTSGNSFTLNLSSFRKERKLDFTTAKGTGTRTVNETYEAISIPIKGEAGAIKLNSLCSVPRDLGISKDSRCLSLKARYNGSEDLG